MSATVVSETTGIDNNSSDNIFIFQIYKIMGLSYSPEMSIGLIPIAIDYKSWVSSL